MNILKFDDFINESKVDSKDDELEKVYLKYSKEDYFGYKDDIKSKIEEWEHACKKGDKTALKVTKEDIEKEFEKIEKKHFEDLVTKMKKWIKEKDVDALIKHVRYDQKISLEIYSILTGDNIKNKTNAQLKDYFKSKYE